MHISQNVFVSPVPEGVDSSLKRMLCYPNHLKPLPLADRARKVTVSQIQLHLFQLCWQDECCRIVDHLQMLSLHQNEHLLYLEYSSSYKYLFTEYSFFYSLGLVNYLIGEKLNQTFFDKQMLVSLFETFFLPLFTQILLILSLIMAQASSVPERLLKPPFGKLPAFLMFSSVALCASLQDLL